MAFYPIGEYLDVAPEGDRLEITIRLRGADCEPGTRCTLRLRTRRGAVVATASATVHERVDTVGHWGRSAFTFVVDVAALPEGALRLELADGAAWVPVDPSTGLLAQSRPLPIAGGRRVQAFPAPGRPSLWLRVGSEGRGGRLAWTGANLARDAAFALHGRRFAWIRAARAATRPFVPAAPVWLIGERPETARDNGRALFAHLRATRPDAAVFYVITADSPMRAAVEPLGNVVTHSSWRHRVLMLHADVLANAYSVKHMLPQGWHPGAYMRQAAWRTGAHRVYLKHGVHLSPYAVKRANGGYDLVAAVGPGEAEAITATSGYGAQVVQTGLARYDALVRPAQRSRTILFMPTWRRYLVPVLFSGSDETLVAYQGSTYQRFVSEFLGSERLAALLAEHDLTLQVVPHYNLASLLTTEGLGTDRAQLLDASTADIPALLRSCDLLVTDYSSVQFDVAYVGTPVVYCQFDDEEYTAGHSAVSWFEVARDGFGPVTHDVAGAVEAIERYVVAGFAREPEYEQRVSAVFAHDDQHNAERLVRAIDALSGDRPASR